MFAMQSRSRCRRRGRSDPAGERAARSLADWAMYVGNTHTPPPLAQTLGPLKPWTGQQYAYFGFPYPRSAARYRRAGRVLQRLRRSGWHPADRADALAGDARVRRPGRHDVRPRRRRPRHRDRHRHRLARGDPTTHMVPGGRYSTVSVTGTGHGTAHIEVFGVVGAPLTSYARKISNYVVGVHAGATGALRSTSSAPPDR